MPKGIKSLEARISEIPLSHTFERLKCSHSSLPSKVFNQVLDSLQKITKKYLNPKKTFMKQPGAVPKLSRALKVKYPDIYDRGTPNSKIRLNCAFMYIKMYSRGLRARLLCQVRGNSALDNTANKENVAIESADNQKPVQKSYPPAHPHPLPSHPTVTLEPRVQCDPEEPARSAITGASFKRPSLFPATVTPRTPEPMSSPPGYTPNERDDIPTSSPVGYHIHKEEPSATLESISFPRSSTFISEDTSKQATTSQQSDRSALANRSTYTEASSSCQSRSKLPAGASMVNTDDFVYRFLDECPVRSMVRLRDAFLHVDLTAEHIRVIGTTWTMAQIEAFLRKVFASNAAADGEVVPDIDLIFLAHHFVNYFRDAGKVE